MGSGLSRFANPLLKGERFDILKKEGWSYSLLEPAILISLPIALQGLRAIEIEADVVLKGTKSGWCI